MAVAGFAGSPFNVHGPISETGVKRRQLAILAA